MSCGARVRVSLVNGAGSFVAAPDQQVAITDAGHELERAAILRIAGDLLLSGREQLACASSVLM